MNQRQSGGVCGLVGVQNCDCSIFTYICCHNLRGQVDKGNARGGWHNFVTNIGGKVGGTGIGDEKIVEFRDCVFVFGN